MILSLWKASLLELPKAIKRKTYFLRLSPSLHASWAFFKKRHARLFFFRKKFFQLLFSRQLLGRRYEKYEKPKVFSSTEKMLSSSLVSSNYWHAKVPCSSCLVLARLCSVGKDLSSTWWESRCYFLRWWYDCYFDGSRATNLATVRRSFFLLSLEVCHSTTTIQHSTT